MKLVGRLGRWLGWIRSVLDVEEKPFRSMGFTAILLLRLGFVVALPFVG